MRLVIQRVKRAGVSINGQLHAAIQQGFLVLLGIEEEDSEDDVIYLAAKLCAMRIFSDAEGKMNLDLRQVHGEVLLVSQFTLYASTKKGNRPSFLKSARPEKAMPLYEIFISEISRLLAKPCKTGVFGADMEVELVNDGPVTILLDSRNRE